MRKGGKFFPPLLFSLFSFFVIVVAWLFMQKIYECEMIYKHLIASFYTLEEHGFF